MIKSVQVFLNTEVVFYNKEIGPSTLGESAIIHSYGFLGENSV